MKWKTRLVAIKIDDDFVRQIDRLVKKGVYRDRSFAINIAVYQFLKKEAEAMDMTLEEFMEKVLEKTERREEISGS